MLFKGSEIEGINFKFKVNIMKIMNVNGTNVSENCKIELKGNPKRVGSKAWMRYEEYADAKTIGEYLTAGGLLADLRYDSTKGFLKILEKFEKGNIVKVG